MQEFDENENDRRVTRGSGAGTSLSLILELFFNPTWHCSLGYATQFK